VNHQQAENIQACAYRGQLIWRKMAGINRTAPAMAYAGNQLCRRRHDMTEHDLKTLLEQLRSELEAAEHGDPRDRERLQGLLGSLQHRLANPREDNEDEELLETISDALTRYEVEHPRITAVLNRIMVSLGL
jgi:hypothetical protein